MHLKTSKAFTLAEVLVTLAIIGVVAAMTIPSLISNTQGKQYKVAVKKNFSVINQAIKEMAIENNGSMTNICTADVNNCLLSKFTEHISTAKTCAHYHVYGECINNYEDLKLLNGTPGFSMAKNAINGHAGLITNDGTSLVFTFSTPDCNVPAPDGKICGYLHMDVNGLKGPNTLGIDLFSFYIAKNELLPFGFRNEAWLDCDRAGEGDGCAKFVLTNTDY